MKPKTFFQFPAHTSQKQYEALRAFFLDGHSAEEAAEMFGYSISAFYSLSRDFRKLIKEGDPTEFFFKMKKPGRNPNDNSDIINPIIIALRKKYLSTTDIKAILDVQGFDVSLKYIYNVLKKDDFRKLPRRDNDSRVRATASLSLKAPKSRTLDFNPETFTSQNTLGVMALIPLIQSYGIDNLISQSSYPESNEINKISSILSFVALKLSNVRRYSADDAWCMDRGLGLFAGLNVLPKTAWFSSYSSRITREMNRDFLKNMNILWKDYGLLSDTANLDFTAIPYWGDTSHLENNWSGNRNKAIPSMLSVLGQDPESGIITYGDTTIRHKNKSDIATEFLDFYKEGSENNLRYLVFDSQFTTYENLSKLNKSIKFLTIRRRGKNIVNNLNARPSSDWKRVRVPMVDGKGRTLKVIDERIRLRDYDGELRQIAITGHGKIKPALLITNDFDASHTDLIRKYSRRWIVEKEISEQIEFFHLNRTSSSMVIKVDFDLTMSILAHNLIRLFASYLPGYSHKTDQTIYSKFLSFNGDVEITETSIIVKLKKKRNLPMILTMAQPYQQVPIDRLGGRNLIFLGDTTS